VEEMVWEVVWDGSYLVRGKGLWISITYYGVVEAEDDWVLWMELLSL
jgi:hypothetical protein